MPDLRICFNFDVDTAIVVSRKELRCVVGDLKLVDCALCLRERAAKRSDYRILISFRSLGGVILCVILIKFNNLYIVCVFPTFLHSYIKKRVEWYIGRKKYNIYYVYNYILPQYPLKNRHFRGV